jgi:hypothetical protein
LHGSELPLHINIKSKRRWARNKNFTLVINKRGFKNNSSAAIDAKYLRAQSEFTTPSKRDDKNTKMDVYFCASYRDDSNFRAMHSARQTRRAGCLPNQRAPPNAGARQSMEKNIALYDVGFLHREPEVKFSTQQRS